jgi:xanthine dehydrogenase small subunit
MTTRPVKFFHRGTVVQLRPASPTRTVLEWLREDAHCTGTKEGCAEGDCGACTVVLGVLDEAGQLRVKPVNSCIQFVPTLHGKALFTVEDLAGPGGRLHPVQQAMVEQHGSQCGFCTPGFVMSLWACYQRHQAAGTVPTRQQLADDLSGNLCRCTGYRPILDAGQEMFEISPAGRLDTAPVAAALRALQSEAPLSNEGEFHAPRSVHELAALRVAKPQARLLAGSTDVGVWVNKQFRALGEIIYTGDVGDMQRVDITDDGIEIGAAASLESAWQGLVGQWPQLRDLWLRFASLPIREAGTMGGNVANGSPIGDAAPVLMALGATLVLRQGGRVRRLALDDFYTGYMQNRLEPGEFLQAIVVPRRRAAQRFRAYKISKRFDSDISALCGAFAIELEGDTITSARLAFGGMAATVQRARQSEVALCGQPWNEGTLVAAMAALQSDFKPLTDMRASSDYRMQVAQNLLRRFWLETRPGDALPDIAVNVWAREELA